MSCEEVVGTTIKAKEGAGSRSLYTLFLTKRGADSPIPVAEGLANKDEAEWMADQIHQAVEQQTVSA
jgi:superfamily I DNA/RNA helicase